MGAVWADRLCHDALGQSPVGHIASRSVDGNNFESSRQRVTTLTRIQCEYSDSVIVLQWLILVLRFLHSDLGKLAVISGLLLGVFTTAQIKFRITQSFLFSSTADNSSEILHCRFLK